MGIYLPEFAYKRWGNLQVCIFARGVFVFLSVRPFLYLFFCCYVVWIILLKVNAAKKDLFFTCLKRKETQKVSFATSQSDNVNWKSCMDGMLQLTGVQFAQWKRSYTVPGGGGTPINELYGLMCCCVWYFFSRTCQKLARGGDFQWSDENKMILSQPGMAMGSFACVVLWLHFFFLLLESVCFLGSGKHEVKWSGIISRSFKAKYILFGFFETANNGNDILL